MAGLQAQGAAGRGRPKVEVGVVIAVQPILGQGRKAAERTARAVEAGGKGYLCGIWGIGRSARNNQSAGGDVDVMFRKIVPRRVACPKTVSQAM